ncbi:hypothetical protein [Beijerinckia sp. L45]|uniref:hypothetical protein n=1 Tax=Beijerinckia sp. L45 TaxID=1641855 RepID=UPI00131DFE1C|nr:hypothetical protein [Beijerinckia sp. L45]
MRDKRTVAMWLVSFGTLGVAGLLATAFAMMAFGLDPSEMITAGAEPWTNAAVAAAAFGGLVITTGLSLWVWHFTRWRMVALVLTVIEVGCVAWACASVYRDYF